MELPPSISDPTPRLADRLDAARHGGFVGRAREIETFRAALVAVEPSFAVLHVHGPGGVGKSALLREYARVAAAAGRPVVAIDGRDIEATPHGFLHALRIAAGVPSDADRLESVDLAPDSVLLIDTCELLAPLDTWMREVFLLGLPAHALVVLAGRNPPAAAWRTDLAWASLTHVTALENLHPEESRSYLAARGVPEARQDDALSFTRGHPLALALVADVLRRDLDASVDDLRDAPDIVRVLVERLVEDAPTVQHRQALTVCTLARATTESLLADVLRVPDAHALFAWLRQLSCIEQGPYGLFPHDLARDVLEAELRMRDPEGEQRLSRHIYSAKVRWLASAGEYERQRLQMDALYAVRIQSRNAAYFDWTVGSDAYAAALAAGDAAEIIDMVRTHEGDASAAIAHYWLTRQPSAFRVFRESDGTRFGFLALLSLRGVTAEDIAADPAIGPALATVSTFGPATPDEDLLHVRFWMHQEHYQAVTAAINFTAVTVVSRCVTDPKIAWNFVTMADPAFWQPHFAGVNFPRAAMADFGVGGRDYGVFAHDWRVEPVADWLAMRATLMPHALGTVATIPQAARRVRLPREEFDAAVRQALRDYTRPDRLATNPLLRSGVVGASSADAGPTALQAALRVAVSTLTGNPKDIKFHRAVWHTYFEPAPTQEQAAELLDIPFNTYRYRLAIGVERITDYLRRQAESATGH